MLLGFSYTSHCDSTLIEVSLIFTFYSAALQFSLTKHRASNMLLNRNLTNNAFLGLLFVLFSFYSSIFLLLQWQYGTNWTMTSTKGTREEAKEKEEKKTGEKSDRPTSDNQLCRCLCRCRENQTKSCSSD